MISARYMLDIRNQMMISSQKNKCLPPKRLKWTVIFVATDGSAKPVISCAAKMFNGLCLHANHYASKFEDFAATLRHQSLQQLLANCAKPCGTKGT